MARPSARENLFLWELIVAFAFIVAAVVLQTFHFFNNAWLVQRDSSREYQRGMGDDCVKFEKFENGIKCTEWGVEHSTFIINGDGVNAEDVLAPSAGMKASRVFLIISALLYLAVIFTLFVICVKKKDLRIQKILCGSSVLLISLNVIVLLLVLNSSFSPFIATKGQCALGSAYGYTFLSNVLLWIGCAANFDSWRDVYASIRAARQLALNARLNGNMHAMEERRPSFLNL